MNPPNSLKNRRKEQKKRLRVSLLIFFTCLLFTFSIWDHYFNSESEIDRALVSNLLLLTGTLFSISAGLFTYSLEQARTKLSGEVAKSTEQLLRRNEELETALREVKTLRGFLPMCASCRKVRNDKGYWQDLEHYIEQHSDASFSHGFCKECMQKLYPEYRGSDKQKSGAEKST